MSPKIFVPKNFGAKKVLGPKNIWSKKMFFQFKNVFGPNKFVAPREITLKFGQNC